MVLTSKDDEQTTTTSNVTTTTEAPTYNPTKGVEVKNGDELQKVTEEQLNSQMDKSPKTADNNKLEIIWTLRGWIVSLMSKNILRACLKNELYG